MSIKYVHDRMCFPLNPQQTVSEKLLYKFVGIPIYCVIGGIAMVVGLPILGVAYGIDAVANHIQAKKDAYTHAKLMKADWLYRLHHLAPNHNTLSLWQEDLNKYDQHIRKILMISEASDIPYIVWQDLLEHDRSFWKEEAENYKTTEWTTERHKKDVEMAIQHYTRLHSKLRNKNLEDADTFVKEIVLGRREADDYRESI